MIRLCRVIAGVVLATSALVAFPMQTAATAAPGDTNCFPGEIYCTPNVQIVMDDPKECTDSIYRSVFQPCTGAIDETQPESAPTNQDANAGLDGLTQDVHGWASGMARFILVDELGGRDSFVTPVLDCKTSEGAAKEACTGKSPWLIDQFEIMRSVAIFIVVPLFFVMVIQSILHGSLNMLLRGALIMLPVSVLGTVVVIAFMQLLLNISDNMSMYIAAKAFTGTVATCKNTAGVEITGPTCTLTNSIVDAGVADGGSFQSFIWAVLFIFAAGVIWLELVSRQIGIYMMTLLMPLGFAAMVWPRSISIGKKLIQYEIALIFSKVFIAAAISLGMAAIGHTGTTSGDEATGVTSGGTNGSLQAMIVGTLILLLATFASGKVVMLSPAAAAQANTVLNKNTIWSRGQGMTVLTTRTLQYVKHSNSRKRAGSNFSTGSGSGSVAGTVPVARPGGPAPAPGPGPGPGPTPGPAPPPPSGPPLVYGPSPHDPTTAHGRGALQQEAAEKTREANALEQSAQHLRNTGRNTEAADLRADADALRDTADAEQSALTAFEQFDQSRTLSNAARMHGVAGNRAAAASSRIAARTEYAAANTTLDTLDAQGRTPSWATGARPAPPP